MENKKHFLALLLILGACAGTSLSTAQAAIADAVVAWGDNDFGQTTVPLAAQSGVTAIAAGEVSHRGLEERRHRGGVGRERLRPSNRTTKPR